MDHSLVADRVLKALGGEDNIVAAAHCATRLRLVLKDADRVDRAALDNDEDLKGTFESGGMFQVIVGPGDVDTVFAELDKKTSKNIAVSTDELKNVAAKSGNRFTRAVKVLADIFVPLIPILVGGGLLMAINNVLVAGGLFGEHSLVERFPQIAGLAEMINVLASAPFAFLPVLVGFTATKRFGGNEFLGAGMAMAMVSPALVSGYEVAQTITEGGMPYWDLFGLNVAQAGYQGTVLPILVVSWLIATVEKFLRRRLKGTVDFLVTPVLTLLVTGFITFIAVGPAMRWVGDMLGLGLARGYELAGPLGGLIFGLVYSPIVITGLHQSFPPFEIQLWNQGGSFIFAIASMANIAQGAATLAVYTLARSPKLKGLAGASGISAIFGITEPAIFGVNLRLRWPFLVAMAGGALGGMLVALFGVTASALGAAGFIGVVSISEGDWFPFLIATGVVFVVTFAVAWIYGRTLVKRNGSIDPDAVEAVQPVAAAPSSTAVRVNSPLTGEAVELSTVEDAMFASGKLGAGVAVVPTDGRLVAPVDGTVTVAFPSGHAFAVRGESSDGQRIDVLMHIGFDTVQLKGQHFTPHVSKGDTVKAGDLLCEFDIAGIEAAGYQVTTPVVVSNSKKTGPVAPVLELPAHVACGDELLVVEPAPVATEA